MRLYKMELYKLSRKKIFPIGILCSLAFQLLIFCQNANAVTSTINGVEYHGYAAIKADREITEDFHGALTDEKIQQIVEKYGFPRKFVMNRGIVDGNFLNTFVMYYASDGYAYGWDDYKLATRTVPLADTELGKVYAESGDDIILEYYAGWRNFAEFYFTGMLLMSAILLCVVSTVFSEEEQTGMKKLLFTTQEGPAKDTHAKVAAAFTLSAALWAAATLFDVLLYGTVYGWDGLKCATYLVDFPPSSTLPFGLRILCQQGMSLLGVLELCAITLCISACCHSAFHSVSAAALCWGMPILAFSLLRNVYGILSASGLGPEVLMAWSICLFIIHMLIYSTPFYMVHMDMISELESLSIRSVRPLHIVIAMTFTLTVLCSVCAYRRYRRVRR